MIKEVTDADPGETTPNAVCSPVPSASARIGTAGVSFSVKRAVGDTSTVAWLIVEPA